MTYLEELLKRADLLGVTVRLEDVSKQPLFVGNFTPGEFPANMRFRAEKQEASDDEEFVSFSIRETGRSYWASLND